MQKEKERKKQAMVIKKKNVFKRWKVNIKYYYSFLKKIYFYLYNNIVLNKKKKKKSKNK